MKKSKYLNLSILLSIISIIITVFINIRMANEFLRSDGKTRALFGMKELYQFGYQYDVVILGVISLIIALFNIKGNDQRRKALIAVLLSIIALVAVFARIWRLFV